MLKQTERELAQLKRQKATKIQQTKITRTNKSTRGGGGGRGGRGGRGGGRGAGRGGAQGGRGTRDIDCFTSSLKINRKLIFNPHVLIKLLTPEKKNKTFFNHFDYSKESIIILST